MDWFDKKFLKTTFRLALLMFLVIITYWLYAYYQRVNIANNEMQNQMTVSNNIDSVRLSQMQASADRYMDSIKNLHNKDSQSALNTHINPDSEQNDSLVIVQERNNTNLSFPAKRNDSFASAQATVHEKNNDESWDTKNSRNTNALHGPSACFSRECTMAIGKTIPVTILWANAGAIPVHFKLVTIKLDDISNKKARFTIEDPFGVLLFSQTGYAANEKIIIEDERHNINITVLQVHANSVTINIASQVTDRIVSKLQKVE